MEDLGENKTGNVQEDGVDERTPLRPSVPAGYVELLTLKGKQYQQNVGRLYQSGREVEAQHSRSTDTVIDFDQQHDVEQVRSPASVGTGDEVDAENVSLLSHDVHPEDVDVQALVRVAPLYSNRAEKLYRQVAHFIAKDLQDHNEDFPFRLSKDRPDFKNFVKGSAFVTNKIWVPAFWTLFTWDMFANIFLSSYRYGTTFPQVLGGFASNQFSVTSNFGSDMGGDPIYSIMPLLFCIAIASGGGLWWFDSTRTKIKPKLEAFEAKISTKLYRHYLQWKAGNSEPTRRDALFLAVALGSLFANIRLGIFFGRKIVGLGKYLKALSDCNGQNKQYVYLKDWGNYECVVNNWPFIADFQKFTNQQALDGLLHYSQDPAFILSQIDDVLRAKPSLQVIDFSGLNWSQWPRSQWKALLEKLSTGLRSLKTFNVSTSVSNLNFPNDGHIDDLIEFLEKVATGQLDIHNQKIGNLLARKFAAVLRTLSYADFTSTQLNDVSFLANNTAKMETLKIGQNPIGNPGVSIIASEISSGKSVMTEIELPKVAVDEEGLDILGQALSQSKLRKLIFTDNDFSQADFYSFGQNVGNSTVEEINLARTQMDNSQPADFVSGSKTGNLHSVDLSENDFQDGGAVGAALAAKGSSVQSLVMNGDAISDDGITVAANALNQTNVTDLGLSETQVTSEGFKVLLSEPTLKKLDASNNPNGDGVASSLSTIPNNVEKIILRNTRMTIKGARDIAKAISSPTSTLRVLDLSDNGLSGDAVTIIINALPASKIEKLTLNGNTVNQNATDALVSALPQSKVKELYIRNTQLDDEDFLEIVRSLITETPHGEQIGMDALSRDEARWIRDPSRTSNATSLIKLDARDNNLGFASHRACEQVMPSLPIEYEIGNSTSAYSRNRSFFRDNSPMSENIAIQSSSAFNSGHTNGSSTALVLGATAGVPTLVLFFMAIGSLAAIYGLYRLTRYAFGSEPTNDVNEKNDVTEIDETEKLKEATSHQGVFSCTK